MTDNSSLVDFDPRTQELLVASVSPEEAGRHYAMNVSRVSSAFTTKRQVQSEY